MVPAGASDGILMLTALKPFQKKSLQLLLISVSAMEGPELDA